MYFSVFPISKLWQLTYVNVEFIFCDLVSDKCLHCIIIISSSLCITVLRRKPVEELLERLFLSFEIVTGAKHLKQLCLSEAVDFKPMHSHLRFDCGDGGGVKVVVTDDSGSVTYKSLFYIYLLLS